RRGTWRPHSGESRALYAGEARRREQRNSRAKIRRCRNQVITGSSLCAPLCSLRLFTLSLEGRASFFFAASRIFRQAEWNVHDSFQIDGCSLLRARTEFPLAQRADGIGVKLLVDSAHELNGVDRTVAANHCVQNNFAADALGY